MSIPESENPKSTVLPWWQILAMIFLLLGCPIIASRYVPEIRDMLGSVDSEVVIPSPTSSPSPVPTDVILGISVTACLDQNQLLVSIQFDRSVTGEISFNLATTSPDYVLRTTFTKLENHWDFVIPDISFPEGSNIHGGIVYLPDDASPVALSQLVYDFKVAGCGTEPTATPTPTPSPTPNPDGIPVIINSQCLSSQQLMIVFQFAQSVTGQYELFVNGALYEIAPVPSQPARLYFFGAAPAGGGYPKIVLRSLPDHGVVLELTDYQVPQCDFQSPGGGGGDYEPPPTPPGGY
jgi:hypothetical protein